MEEIFKDFEKMLQDTLQKNIPFDRDKIRKKRKTNWFDEYEAMLIPLITQNRAYIRHGDKVLGPERWKRRSIN